MIMVEDIEGIVKKAAAPEIGARARKGKRAIKFRAPTYVLKHYDRQTGGTGKNVNIEKLSDQLEKDGFKLKGEYAEAASHEMLAKALYHAIKKLGLDYRSLISKYAKEKDPDKRAEMKKELDAYKAIVHAQLGVDERLLEMAKKQGFKPETLDAMFEEINTAIEGLDRNAFLGQIPEETAYKSAEKLATKYKFKKEAVRPLGPEKARRILLTDHQAKGNKDVFKEAHEDIYY